MEPGRLTPSAWDPGQYDRFQQERRQPFFDLLALVRPRPRMRVVDLGCGTGELTQHLHRHLGAESTLGIDRSETMLAGSSAFAGDGLRFEQGDVADFRAERAYDLVFSNAALQWVPDHEELFRRLSEALIADGQLAIQMPANYEHPSHVLADEVGQEEPFRQALQGFRLRPPILKPEGYAALLDRLKYREQLVRLQVYVHKLESREQVVEWVKGSLLTPYRERLSSDVYARFVDRYRQRLLSRLEDTRPYFYPFPRLLLWAQR